jgi:hypothetical protein
MPDPIFIEQPTTHDAVLLALRLHPLPQTGTHYKQISNCDMPTLRARGTHHRSRHRVLSQEHTSDQDAERECTFCQYQHSEQLIFPRYYLHRKHQSL